MDYKLLILDKDGTIVRPKSGGQFVKDPADQAIIPSAMAALSKPEYKLTWKVIASNQGGVEAGHKTTMQAIQEMQYLMLLCPLIKCCYFAPGIEKEDACICVEDGGYVATVSEVYKSFHSFRKPGPGMLKLAIHRVSRFLGLTSDELRAKTLFVGDRPEDEQAAESAEVAFQWADQWRGDV